MTRAVVRRARAARTVSRRARVARAVELRARAAGAFGYILLMGCRGNNEETDNEGKARSSTRPEEHVLPFLNRIRRKAVWILFDSQIASLTGRQRPVCYSPELNGCLLQLLLSMHVAEASLSSISGTQRLTSQRRL